MLGLIGAAALAAGTPASGASAPGAADWRLAGGSDRAVSYLDMASIGKAGDGTVRFARWMVLGAEMASGADAIRDSFEATCATGGYRVLAATAFAGAREIGRMPASAGTAAPGTVIASLIAIACGTRPPAGATISDPALDGRARLKAPIG